MLVPPSGTFSIAVASVHTNNHNNSNNSDDDDGKKAPSSTPRARKPASVRDVEKEWEEMRVKTLLARAPTTASEHTNAMMRNKMRMRRLGLITEEDEEYERRQEERLAKYRKDPEMPERAPAMRETTGRRSQRRPITQKDKQFTSMTSAPEDVRHRQFLIPDEPDHPRALDVAVIGRPNAGKSSIMNRLLGTTVSAVSAKYNTTRDRVHGILTEKDSQITFFDTPGLIKPKESHEYVRSLVTTAAETVESVDVSMLVVDSVKRLDDAAIEALSKVLTTSAQVASPTLLVMNKYDLVTDRERKNFDAKVQDLSEMIEEIYDAHYDKTQASVSMDPLAYLGKNCLKVSALRGSGVGKLKSTLMSLAVDRPWNFHSSMVSDQSDLDLVTEIIREKLFRRFNKELPYQFEQENAGWTKFKDKSIRIDQDIFVPAARVRKMVIGRNGDTIRAVGIAAREEIEALLKRPVHLYLNVRVRS
ncbi:TPA: hypothetical protein N0F65_008640 [Lagenidium giganteum]|uniref:GTP-binding protein Era n=1 Tax=Lagenidium giganteum TaxID=4803 RepID=A0AAV2Z4Y0_9STRA|nr:TPA: hypothetical protein N0F65_008640 [Lagenidium giganteum]